MSIVYDQSRLTNEKQLRTQARISELQDWVNYGPPGKKMNEVRKEIQELQVKCDHRWLKDEKDDFPSGGRLAIAATEIDDDGKEIVAPKEDLKVRYRCKHCSKEVVGKPENVGHYLKSTKKAPSKGAGKKLPLLTYGDAGLP
jgi:hypothetical protein